jgi:hypothetical protein
MKKLNAMIGKKFNSLTVLKFAGVKLYKNKNHKYFLLCKCDCGNLKEIDRNHVKNGNTKSCGCRKKTSQKLGKESPCWKGGRRIEEGYVLIYNPYHPRSKKNGYVREHTMVMEEKIGRYLLKGESVHHKNGDKEDNRPENLELWSSSQPSGQRVEDKLKWAREIISLYE